MKSRKRMAALLTSVLIAAETVGCAGNGMMQTHDADAPEEAQIQETDAPEETKVQESGAAEGGQAQDAAVEEAKWQGEITEINALFFDVRGIGDNAGPIFDAMNAITEESIGVRINPTLADSANYGTQLGLTISGGEQLDLCCIIPGAPANFTSLTANEQLMDISELLQEEAPETYELTKDYINAMAVGSAIYGVPCYRNYASGIYLLMREDILEKVGMLEGAEKISTWAEFEKILEAVKQDGTVAGIANQKNILMQAGNLFSGEKFSDSIQFDALGDIMNLIYTSPDGEVSILAENADFQEQQDRVRSWYNNGYVYKDSMVTDDHVDTLTKAGVVFSSVQTSEMGVEAAHEEATGYQLVCVELSKNLLGSSYINKFGMGVPVTAQEPEAAVRWINALWTDPRLENLITWGQEGKDYVIRDGIAVFPEGITSENVAYHNYDFMYGNYFNAYPWDGAAADFREAAMSYLQGAEVSPFLGFSPDLSSVTNTVSALNSVFEKYRGTIYCGAYSDEDYADYISELKVAGIDEYVNLYQEQLDQWKSAE